MGIETVAIYSDIDKYSKHVQMANIGIHVGENPSSFILKKNNKKT